MISFHPLESGYKVRPVPLSCKFAYSATWEGQDDACCLCGVEVAGSKDVGYSIGV
jgi:hypothetical protein